MHPATRLYGNAIALALVFPTLSAAQAVELTQAPVEAAEERRSQSINGTLDADDAVLDSGEYYEIHTFEGTEGQAIAIDLVSEEFDTYLVVFGPEGDRVGENDDGDDSNAQLWLTLPSTGTYTVWATSYSAGEVGSYALTWQEDIAFADDLAELQQELGEAREASDRDAELGALFDIAWFYRDKEQNTEAIAYFQQVIALDQELGTLTFQPSSYQSLSLIYQDQTRALIAEQRYDEARLPEQKSIETAQLAVELAEEELSVANSRDSDK